MPTNTCTLWCLLVAWCLLCSRTTAQRTAYTPGGLRSIGSELEDIISEDDEASNAASRLGVEGLRLDAQGPQQDSHDGELLFQSIPNFPEAESRALATFTGILRGPSQHQHDDSTGSSSSNHQSSTGAVAQQYRSAADEFLQALLKTTRASLASSSSSSALHNPAQHSDRHRTNPGQGSGSDNSMPADTKDASEDITDIDIEEGDEDEDDAGASEHPWQSRSTASTEGPTLQTSLSADTAAAAAAIGTELLAAAAAAADSTQDGSSSQRIADTASAVDGQVLVTQAEIIPSMQHYSQVVLTSLKMRPMLAQELLLKATASREGAGVTVPAALNAAAWQDGLKQALESAAAAETNTSTSQMHTRMTSIINLGIELAEPPLAYASAVASSVANSIKALTGDESVLVGVSLIRLGYHPAPHNTTVSPSGGAAAASNSSNKGADTQPAQKLNAAAAAAGAGQNSMLAMLTLYGVGAPTNAVQVVSTMHQACPELFTYGASLTNSSCGRSIVASYTAAVLAAEATEAEVKSRSINASPSAAVQAAAAAAATAAATAAAPAQPSRSLLEDSRETSDSTSQSKMSTKTWTVGKRTTLVTVKVTTGPVIAPLSSSSSSGTGSRNAAEAAAATNKASNSGGSKTGSSNMAAAAAPATKLGNNSSSSDKSGEKSQAAATSSEVAVAATAAATQAARQNSPEVAAFLHHSHHFLKVRQQPEVNIIVTQAVGVAPGQLPSTLADKLQQLAVSQALADLLAMSGLTLAQAGKPQTIDLSSAAAGLGSSSTLAAASALGAEAAAFGSGRGAAGSSDGSSRRPAVTRAEGPEEGGVATPAVIGMAVAVAVSVMAVCVTAVVIVVVKQRAKAARAAAAAAEDHLPKSAKRRRSTKGKGVTSKYLPTSHPALAHGPQAAPDGRPFPPPPCVIVTAVSGPCQHTPGQSPCKPCLPSHLPAPLNSAGSAALNSMGSGSGDVLTSGTAAAAAAAAAAGGGTGAASCAGGLSGAGGVSPLGYHAGLLGPAVTRGDSVSSAVMADFAEQRRQLQAEVGEGDRDEEEDTQLEGQGSEQQLGEVGSGGYDWTESEQGQDTQQQQQLWGSVRGPAALAGHSHCHTNPSSSNANSHCGWRSTPQATDAAPTRPDGGAGDASSSSSMALLAQRSALPTLRTLYSVNSGGQDQPGSCPHSSKSQKASPFMTYDVSVLLGAASAAAAAPAADGAAEQCHPAATAAAVAGPAAAASATDSGMLFPQWTSSPRYSAGTFGAPGSPASPCCGIGPVATCSGSPTAAQSKEGTHGHEYGSPSAQHAKQGYHTQQQQQGHGQRSLRAAASHGAARSPVRHSPFMRPCNVPPGLE